MAELIVLHGDTGGKGGRPPTRGEEEEESLQRGGGGGGGGEPAAGGRECRVPPLPVGRGPEIVKYEWVSMQRK